jgi:acyl-CoA thioesterase I
MGYDGMKVERRIFMAGLALGLSVVPAKAATKTVLALGDSLVAGYGLEPQFAFPTRLEAALKANGLDVTVVNGGVSGDTAAQGEARLDWVLTDDVDAVIVELGANDALRGLDPAQAEAALTRIMDRLAAKHLPVLIAGMKAPPNMGADYVSRFDSMYARLAEKYGAVLYPFYLEGVAADRTLNQYDGIHPNAKGVEIIVNRMLPLVEGFLAKVK